MDTTAHTQVIGGTRQSLDVLARALRKHKEPFEYVQVVLNGRHSPAIKFDNDVFCSMVGSA